MMLFDELFEVEYDIKCEFAGDGVDYFDSILTLIHKQSSYEIDISMTSLDVENLRENCKRILKATEE